MLVARGEGARQRIGDEEEEGDVTEPPKLIRRLSSQWLIVTMHIKWCNPAAYWIKDRKH